MPRSARAGRYGSTPGDDAAAALLRARGHVLDARAGGDGPRARAGRVERPAQEALEDWRRPATSPTSGRLNDRAYAFGTDSFSRALRRLPDGAASLPRARPDGEPVACLADARP